MLTCIQIATKHIIQLYNDKTRKLHLEQLSNW